MALMPVTICKLSVQFVPDFAFKRVLEVFKRCRCLLVGGRRAGRLCGCAAATGSSLLLLSKTREISGYMDLVCSEPALGTLGGDVWPEVRCKVRLRSAECRTVTLNQTPSSPHFAVEGLNPKLVLNLI